MSSRFERSSGSLRRAELVVLYDGDCGFCALTATVLWRLDGQGRLAMVPLQHASRSLPDAPPLGLPRATMHVCDAAGGWIVGGAAWTRIMRTLPVLRPAGLAASVPPLTRLVDSGYRLRWPSR